MSFPSAVFYRWASFHQVYSMPSKTAEGKQLQKTSIPWRLEFYQRWWIYFHMWSLVLIVRESHIEEKSFVANRFLSKLSTKVQMIFRAWKWARPWRKLTTAHSFQALIINFGQLWNQPLATVIFYVLRFYQLILPVSILPVRQRIKTAQESRIEGLRHRQVNW